MLGLLDRFRKKKETKADTEAAKAISELEQLCGDDKETYEALINTMFLDPRKIETSLKAAVENAKKSEKEKDFVRASAWYRIAGGLAIYEGDVKKVAEFFGQREKISGTKQLILKDPEKAVAIAQEYYKRYLKA